MMEALTIAGYRARGIIGSPLMLPRHLLLLLSEKERGRRRLSGALRQEAIAKSCLISNR